MSLQNLKKKAGKFVRESGFPEHIGQINSYSLMVVCKGLGCGQA